MITPLNSLQLSKLLYKDKHSRKHFRGILARGKVPKAINKFPSFYILNTDYYWKKGIHWIVIGFFKDYTLWFDSFGLSPILYNFPFIVQQKGKLLLQNTLQLQSLNSSACGYYCVYIIYFLCREKPLSEILQHFSKSNKNWNDKYVYNFVKNLAKNE